jgi:hypothetical protein
MINAAYVLSARTNGANTATLCPLLWDPPAGGGNDGVVKLSGNAPAAGRTSLTRARLQCDSLKRL